MSPADWIILAIVLLNIVAAAMQGFFAEALSMAGLVVGYIVAAWQYQRLAAWLATFLKNEWLAEILGFFVIFFVVVSAVRHCGQNCALGDEGSRVSAVSTVS